MADSPTSALAADAADQPVNTKLLIPKNDGKLSDVCRLVSDTWAQEPWLTLRWKTQPEFAQLLTVFTSSMTNKRAAASARTPQSQRLQELDDEMDQGLRILKNYVLETAGYNKAAAEALLPGFGLVRPGSGGYWLAEDRDERLVALRDMLLPAVTKSTFKTREYGTAFWQAHFDEYKTLLGQTDGLAGTVTKSVSKKDVAKKELRRVLQAIIYALKANYPDTFEAELRAWGFRKTSY